ncbi:MAG: ABC transporter permease subunit [Rhodospirillales bacterium]|nr:MAG: ABC transporter permease subunit [Rhodospirillales bacterium]
MPHRLHRRLLAALVVGYAFLYVPIASVVVYSFNESKLATVWAGFSLRWWGEFFRNEAMMEAATLSLAIAAASASGATILGTMAGFALARRARFPARTVFAGLVAGPMLLPEVVTGIATLLLFVALERLVGWPERGAATIAIAHVTLSMAFVAVVVQARLADFDRSLEEAALDLGARPAVVFRTITLPLIAPSVAAGWLLAFTLSLDDLIVAQFVAGPQSQTLPMLVYSSVRLGVSPQVNVLATIILVAAASILLVARAFLKAGEPAGDRIARRDCSDAGTIAH